MCKRSLALFNANVVTLNPAQPKAQAILVRDGRIAAVGTDKEVSMHLDRDTKIIDARKETVIPGLVDCHVHMLGFGRTLETLDLKGAKSIKEIQRKLRYYAEGNPQVGWIHGRGWDQEKFSEKRFPTRWDLDKAVADKPVFLLRVCGHVGVANSKALLLAAVTERTRVEDGEIDLDEVSGEPNGILREGAIRLVQKSIPKRSFEELERCCVLACRKAVEVGLTGVHWIVDSVEEVKVLHSLQLSGRLPLRVYLGIPVELMDKMHSEDLIEHFNSDMLKIGFVKILADGSLGGRTAALEEPYADDPETRGMMLYTQKKLNAAILKANESGLQVAVHAIGDRALHAVLEAYGKALKTFPRKDHRHRVEHCSVMSGKLLRYMKRLGLIASVQPHFVVSDFWTVDRLGKYRARWAYPFKSLLRSGITMVSGSDCPVEDINPMLGLWAAVDRKSFPEEDLTFEEALKTYTVNAAYASFDENKKGTLEAGKVADLTVLSDDPFTVKPSDIRKITVKMTIVDGRIVYSKKKTARCEPKSPLTRHYATYK
ncbi:MAG: amidohydrolase [Candidatus Bathyarchaeota archaeon]|nr:amidohydrolase [Candidatus Bathyarchaeota archaeon]